MSTRPTSGTALALAAAAVLHLLVRATGAGWLALGAAAVLVLPLVAVLLRPRLDALGVTATASRGTAGGCVRLELAVTARRASPPCRLVIAPGLLAGAVVAVPALAAGQRTAAGLELAAAARGTTDGLDVVLEATAPLGLLRVRRGLRVPVPVLVRPSVSPSPAASVGSAGGGRGASGSAATSTATAGAGTEVLGLRPWRAGDATSAVHARSTARHGRPVVLKLNPRGYPDDAQLAAELALG